MRTKQKKSVDYKNSVAAILPIDGKGIIKTRVILLLVTLAICAFFSAKGTSDLIALSFLPTERVLDSNSLQSESANESLAPPGSKSPDPKQILKRNVFDSSTGPLWPPPEDMSKLLEKSAPAKEEIPPPSPYDPPPECTQDMFLAASVYFPNAPNRSFVALTGSEQPDEEHLFRRGMQIGEYELTNVLPNAAYLKQPSGDYCSLKLFSDRKPKKKAKKKKNRRKRKKFSRKSRKAKRRYGLSPSEIKKSIKKLSNNSYRVDRELVDKVLKNHLQTVRKVKAIPHRIGGEVVGVKLYRIRRKSLLGQLGIRNGDLLLSINGYDLSNVDSALEAYSNLRNANHLTINLKRRNRRQTLDIQIL